jgi:hypothetical protein
MYFSLKTTFEYFFNLFNTFNHNCRVIDNYIENITNNIVKIFKINHKE